VLPDGNHQNTITASNVTDVARNPLLANNTFDFFFLNGDADRDRGVVVNDLGILASNWQLSPRTFCQGNFDYSGDGLVDVGDLGILASSWQKQLPAPSAPASPLLRCVPAAKLSLPAPSWNITAATATREETPLPTAARMRRGDSKAVRIFRVFEQYVVQDSGRIDMM
jgi:hypothetical protein